MEKAHNPSSCSIGHDDARPPKAPMLELAASVAGYVRHRGRVNLSFALIPIT